ncbi:MAG: hypothetical protein KGJ78_09600 [Alphaproteobacteria bacterium]|nr:hypothetical protein [Alphaproteobacteria bacterium]
MRNVMAAFLAAIVLAPLASAQPAENSSPCFSPRQFVSWKASDPRTVYISVRPHHVYRLELAGSCSLLTRFDSHLLSMFRSASVCTPQDWDLKVSEGPGGPVEACVVKTMTELTPQEADSLPAKFKPAF